MLFETELITETKLNICFKNCVWGHQFIPSVQTYSSRLCGVEAGLKTFPRASWHNVRLCQQRVLQGHCKTKREAAARVSSRLRRLLLGVPRKRKRIRKRRPRFHDTQ